jgi:hypothetical protein
MNINVLMMLAFTGVYERAAFGAARTASFWKREIAAHDT